MALITPPKSFQHEMDTASDCGAPTASQSPIKEIGWHGDGTENVAENMSRESAMCGAKSSETHSPTATSVSIGGRRQMREANLGINPSASGGAAKPTLSFGAAVEKVPAPIVTNVPKTPFGYTALSLSCDLQDVTQVARSEVTPQSLQRIPSADPASDRGNQSRFEVREPLSSNPALCSRNRALNHDQACGAAYGDDVFQANPYAHRADEIGLRHRIPRIGHLGSLLQPACWKEGDEPIGPHEIKELFDTARRDAKAELAKCLDETRLLAIGERAKHDEERDLCWDARYKLDQTLFVERMNVYNEFQRRGHKKSWQIEPKPSNLQALKIPQTLNPPTTTSFLNSPQPAFPYGHTLNGAKRCGNGHSSVSYSQEGGKPFPLPSPSVINPGIVDSFFVPPTLDDVYQRFRAKEADITRQRIENQQFLNRWVASYGPHISQQHLLQNRQLLPSVWREQSSYEYANGYIPTGSDPMNRPSIPQPPAYTTPYEYRCQGLNENPRHPTSDFSKGLNQHQVYENHYAYTPHAYENHFASTPQEKQQDAENPIGGTTSNYQFNKGVEEQETPTKKRQSNPSALKPKRWYQDELAKANLPTSSFSDESIRAALNDEDEEYSEFSPTPTKKRRQKQDIDFEKGISIDSETAKILIAKGVSDRRNQPHAASTVSESFANGATPVPGGLSSQTTPYNPKPSSKVNYLYSRGHPQLTPESDAGSEQTHNRKDGGFGSEAPRLKIITPSKTTTPRRVRYCGQKRQSGDSPIQNKRSRIGVNNVCDTPDPKAVKNLHAQDPMHPQNIENSHT